MLFFRDYFLFVISVKMAICFNYKVDFCLRGVMTNANLIFRGYLNEF